MSFARSSVIGLGLVILAAGCGTKEEAPAARPLEIPETVKIKAAEEEDALDQIMGGKSSVWEGMVEGTVLDADFGTGRVTIDKGFGDVHVGWKFEVRDGGRNGTLISLIEVTRVYNGMSIC